jgi:hypothetical protein
MDLILLTVNGVLGVLASALALSREIVRTRHRTPAGERRNQPATSCGCTARTPAAGADGTASRTR